MRVGVVGIGRVGLVTAAALASIGHDVTGMDADEATVAALRAGRAPFREPGLDDLLARAIGDDRLRFTSSVAEAVRDARIAFVCVGRPPVGLDDRNLRAVEDAARAIARCASDGLVLVVKSTVPPGTSERIVEVVRMERPDVDIVCASSPEFLREGHAIDDTLRPDRMVVGADDLRAFDALRELYAPLVDSGLHVIETDPSTAELSKLASNAFLATKVSFANALARVSERAGADVVGVTEIMGADPRIGSEFLGAGLGYGGYCLPKDVVTLERVADRLGYDFAMLRETSRVNDETLGAVARSVEEAVRHVEGAPIALLGLSFKPGTDDVRGSPALALATRLLRGGVKVVGYDPMAGDAAAARLPELEIAHDPYRAVEGASCVVVCAGWPEFAELDLARLKATMGQPFLVDAWNLLDPIAVAEAGLRSVAVGRSARAPSPVANPDRRGHDR